MDDINIKVRSKIREFGHFCKHYLTSITADVIAWIGLVIIHLSTVPTVLTVMAGVNDRMPPIDMILFVWAGLALFFVRAAMKRDLLNLVTIGSGFIIHAVLLALLIFK